MFERVHLVIILLGLLSLICAFRLLQFSFFQREALTGEIERQWREYSIPAARGRLVDKNGVVLAWTESYVELSLKVPSDRERLEKILSAIIEVDPNLSRNLVADNIIKFAGEVRPLSLNVSPKHYREFVSLGFPELSSSIYFVRRAHSDSRVRELVGRVRREEDGATISGVSGWEKDYDDFIQGTPGRFRVLRDRDGNFVAESWQTIRDVQNGRDYVVDVEVSQILTNTE